MPINDSLDAPTITPGGVTPVTNPGPASILPSTSVDPASPITDPTPAPVQTGDNSFRYNIQLQGSGTPVGYDVKSVDMGANGELIVQHADVDAVDIYAPGEWKSAKIVRA